MIIGRVGRPGLLGAVARTAVISGTATAVSGAVAGRQRERAMRREREYQQTPASPASPRPKVQAAAVEPDLVARLQKLAELQQQGILSPNEFEQAKRQLLAG